VQVNFIHSTLVFRGKNIIYMTMRVNLIHSKLFFFKKNSNSASELHCARKHRILKSSYELLRKIHMQNVKLYGTHQN